MTLCPKNTENNTEAEPIPALLQSNHTVHASPQLLETLLKERDVLQAECASLTESIHSMEILAAIFRSFLESQD